MKKKKKFDDSKKFCIISFFQFMKRINFFVQKKEIQLFDELK